MKLRTISQIANAIRNRASALEDMGLSPRELIEAAEELDRHGVVVRPADNRVVTLEDVFRELQQIKELVMTLRPEVQAEVDAITALTSVVDSAVQGFGTMEAEITAQGQTIATLQAGQALSVDDLAALTSSNANLTELAGKLKAAVPANAAPAAAPAADAGTAGTTGTGTGGTG